MRVLVVAVIAMAMATGVANAQEAAPSPSPLPTQTSCPPTKARVTYAVPPDLPQSVVSGGVPLRGEVLVTVNPDGSVKSASIQTSTGNNDADRDSIIAAKKSKYKPASVDCKPMEGNYVFVTTFTPDYGP